MVVDVIGQMSKEIFALNRPDRQPVPDTDLETASRREGKRVRGTRGLRTRSGKITIEPMDTTDDKLPIEGKPPHGVKRVSRASHVSNQAETLLRLRNVVRSTACYLSYSRDALPDVEQLFTAASVQKEAAAGSRRGVADHCRVANRESDG